MQWHGTVEDVEPARNTSLDCLTRSVNRSGPLDQRIWCDQQTQQQCPSGSGSIASSRLCVWPCRAVWLPGTAHSVSPQRALCVQTAPHGPPWCTRVSFQKGHDTRHCSTMSPPAPLLTHDSQGSTGHEARRTVHDTTCRTQRACRFSPGTTRRNGPSAAARGCPSRRSASRTTRSVNARSSSGNTKTTR